MVTKVLEPYFDPFRTAVPFRGQTTWNLSGLSPKRDCSSERVNPFRTAVPFWGQITSNLTGLSPKRDCGSKRVKEDQKNRKTPPEIIKIRLGSARRKSVHMK